MIEQQHSAAFGEGVAQIMIEQQHSAVGEMTHQGVVSCFALAERGLRAAALGQLLAHAPQRVVHTASREAQEHGAPEQEDQLGDSDRGVRMSIERRR